MLPLRYAVHRTTPRGLAGVVLTHYPLSFCMCKLEYTGGIASTLSTFVEYPFDICCRVDRPVYPSRLLSHN